MLGLNYQQSIKKLVSIYFLHFVTFYLNLMVVVGEEPRLGGEGGGGNYLLLIENVTA